MVISGLTQRNLKEILIKTYVKGIEKENIPVKDLIEEIRHQVLIDSNQLRGKYEKVT